VVNFIRGILNELRIAMLCVGAPDLAALRRAPIKLSAE
jgi:isopentenyl diphosphate isomerase/L-lactate dehydrogenase-like FMN-dependent dehydrogenase